MKLIQKYVIFIVLNFLLVGAKGQTAESPWALSGGGSLISYRPHPGNPALHESIYEWGYQLAVQKYLNSAFEFRTQMLFAPKVSFPEGIITRRSTPLLDFHYRLSFKFNNGLFLRENGLLGPYVSLGLGGSYAEGHPDAYFPIGAGLRLRLNHQFAFRLETTRKISFNKDYQNLSHAVAFIYNLNSEIDQVDTRPQEIPDIDLIASLIPQDTDHDGLIDLQDECPEVAGPIGSNGCPTQDFSGPDPEIMVIDEAKVTQNEEVPALAVKEVPPAYQEEETNEVPVEIIGDQGVKLGIASESNQQLDLAIDEVTPIDNPGEAKKSPCFNPSHMEAIEPIYFAYGKEEVTPTAYDQLDMIADMMKSCPETKLILSGHTDSKGSQKDNLVLSIRRAFNVKYYLVNQHEISQYRISSSGLGEEAPLEGNDTSKGRERNRRVDFRLVF